MVKTLLGSLVVAMVAVTGYFTYNSYVNDQCSGDIPVVTETRRTCSNGVKACCTESGGECTSVCAEETAAAKDSKCCQSGDKKCCEGGDKKCCEGGDKKCCDGEKAEAATPAPKN
jgi:hypothetical protein